MIMKALLKKHYDKFLLGLGAILLLVIIAFYAWSAHFLLSIFEAASSLPAGSEGVVHFNLEEARALEL